MFPYKMFFLQQLLSDIYLPRLGYAQIIRSELSNDSLNPERIVFSHECIFLTNGVVNKLNARVWGLENPCAVEEVPLTSEEAMICCEMYRIIAFISFSNQP